MVDRKIYVGMLAGVAGVLIFFLSSNPADDAPEPEALPGGFAGKLSPVTRSPLLLSCGLLLAGLLLSTACGGCSDSPATPEELCDWQGPGVEVPAWTVERVYDLELRSFATDPSYTPGILELFVDKDAVSVFTRSGYIRTTLDGEVVNRPRSPIAPVVQTSDGFAGYIYQGPKLPQLFCLLSREGELLEDTCDDSLPYGDLYWRAPNIVIISTEIAPSSIVRNTLDVSGRLIEEQRFPLGEFELPFLFGDDTILVGLNRFQDENSCLQSKVNTKIASDVDGPGHTHSWPEGYVLGAAVRQGWVEGPNSGIYQYSVQCLRGSTDRRCNAKNLELGVLAVFKKGSAVPTIKPQGNYGLGVRRLWDGKRFVGFFVEEGTGNYRMRFANEEGDIIGEVTWPIIDGRTIRSIGSFQFAAVAPGDYIIAFSVPSPDNLDRTVRVRVQPPQ